MNISTPESVLQAGSAADGRAPAAIGAMKETVEEIISSRPCREHWLGLMRLVHREYRYSTMYGVHIAGGVIVSCDNIQRSLVFGDASAMSAEAGDELFDAKWQALEALCGRIGSGQLLEVKFSESRPITARTSERGRRFKRVFGRKGL